MKNELLAITLAKMMALNQNLAHIKNSSSFLKSKHCVNTSRDMSRVHFAKNRKSVLTNW